MLFNNAAMITPPTKLRLMRPRFKSGARAVEAESATRSDRRTAAVPSADAELARRGLHTQDGQKKALNNDEYPDPVDPEHIKSVLAAAAEELQRLDGVCSVCDCFTTVDAESCEKRPYAWFDVQTYTIMAKIAAAKVMPPLAPEILAHYDLSLLDPCLAGLLLSTPPRARVPVIVPHAPSLYVCKECADSLRGNSPYPPVNAIANNNAIGILPEALRGSSWAEQAMVSLAYARAWIVVLKGGRQKALRGHTLTCEMDPGATAQKLPRGPADCNLKVVIAGAFTPVQRLASLRVHQVRRKMLTDLLDFFKQHNRFYKFVKIDAEELSKCEDDDSLIRMQGLAVDESGAPASQPEPMGNANLASSVAAAAASAGALPADFSSSEFDDPDVPESRPRAVSGMNAAFFANRPPLTAQEQEELDAEQNAGGASFNRAGRANAEVFAGIRTQQTTVPRQRNPRNLLFGTFARSDEQQSKTAASRRNRLHAATNAEALAEDASDPADDELERVFSMRHVASVNRLAPGAAAHDDAAVDIRPRGVGSQAGAAAAAAPVLPVPPSDGFQAAARAVEDRFNTPEGLVLAVRTGSLFVPEHSTDILCVMFPEKLPYARGGFDECRRKAMSRKEQLKRLLRLSWGTFGDPSFVLKAYNMLARAEAARKAYIRVQLSDMSFDGLSMREVRQLADYQKACSAAMRSHMPLPDPPAEINPTARALFRTAEVCAGVMPHTDQYAKNYGRVRVFSMWNKIHPPTLMLTLNPNDLASLNLLHYAGHNVKVGDELPAAEVRQSAVADSPAAAALSFMRNVDVFIRLVVGWDLKRHKASEKGGFFGVVNGVFGAVEEQNRGSLHLHLLVRVSGALPLALQDQQMLPAQFERLRQRMCKYVESIMTTEVQCPSEFHVCPMQQMHDHALPSLAAASSSSAPDVAEAHASAADPGAQPVVGPSKQLELTLDVHFGQIGSKDILPYRRPLKTAGHGVKSDPHIGVCRLMDPEHAVPLGIQSTARNSVMAARAALGMSVVDLTSKEAFHRWSYQRGPISFVTAPLEPTPDDDEEVRARKAQELVEFKRFIVDLSTVQLGAMAHDSAHNPTCLKNGHTECRFHFPFAPYSYKPGDGPVKFTYPEPSASVQDMAPTAGSISSSTSKSCGM